MKEKRPVILAGLALVGGIIALTAWLRVSYEAPKTSHPPSWREEAAFIDARRALAAAANKQFIYVLGGVSDESQYVASVEFSRIHADGRLAPWQSTRNLPEPRFYLGAAIVNQRLYAVGGATGPLGDDNLPSASVHSAAIEVDGTLGPWRQEAYLTTPRRGLQVVVWQNQIYAVGGYNGTFLRSVERARIDHEGRINRWQLAPQQAELERYMHAATASNNRIYVLTGHIEGRPGMGYASVESAPLNDAGELGAWRRESTAVDQPRFLASATATNNVLYLLGGHDGKTRLASMEAAAIGADGSPGPWRIVATLRAARSAAAVVTANETVYALGGSGPDGGLNTVESVTLN